MSKNQRDIESNMIQDVVAGTNQITYFGRSGVARALMRAVSYVLDQMQFAVDQSRRASFLSTAIEDNLDERAGERGVVRLGVSFSTAVVLFQGDISTVIAAGTQLKSEDGLIFETAEEVTIGTLNPTLDGNASTLATADKTIVTCLTAGLSGNVPRRSINSLVTPIAGVESLTNPMPATGGRDAEEDVSYRFRAFNQVGLLNRDTQDYFHAKARVANPDVLRTYVERGAGLREVKVSAARVNGGNFSANELTAIENEVTKGSPALVDVTFVNVTFTAVSVNISLHRQPGYSLSQVFTNLANDLADFLDWSRWPFDQNVNQNDLLSLCRASEGVEQIEIRLFTPTQNIGVAKDSLPKLSNLTVVDRDTGESINTTIVTAYSRPQSS